MHRSSSASRVSSVEYFSSTSLQSSCDAADQQLPTYDPLSQAAKKERSRLRSAEFAVHAIPLVLLLCAIILWFFSTPELRA
ncbi:hypothetical protein I3843_11G068000 [Carya illinoinensis]|uniref:Uncharacterized protein n=1 Tax=Carya illinoinensis TaxID=32201 RepID=A0A8T1P250_CARIL|nr:hypothetical protein CIPAW_11G070300 [Carya illinoinensis]KAG7955375.1 hypothetical protein I3843_11G068000 [Carya illinoinensis]